MDKTTHRRFFNTDELTRFNGYTAKHIDEVTDALASDPENKNANLRLLQKLMAAQDKINDSLAARDEATTKSAKAKGAGAKSGRGAKPEAPAAS